MKKTVSSKRLTNFIRDRGGVAAVEFAIGAPMMILGMVVMTDLGLAIHQRMNLDQAVRAGAEFAMRDISNEDQLEKLMKGAATGYYSDNDADWDAQNITPPTVSAEKWCECPDNPGVAIACDDPICTNNTGFPPSVYYQLTASKTYEGIILPNIPLGTEIRVQVR